MVSDSQQVNFAVQKGVTRALLKFCQDHQYPDGGLLEVRECLGALEQGDMKAAVQAYQKVPLGGRMGYFDEWVPPVVFSHETPEYVHCLCGSRCPMEFGHGPLAEVLPG